VPKGLGVEINLGTWTVPPVFTFLQKAGNVAELEMLRTFNCGMGYLVIVSAQEAEKALDVLCQAVEEPVEIGRVVAGENVVNYTGNLLYAE
jgi:phosphoribosylformylglycinamidine cyclo-ligase